MSTHRLEPPASTLQPTAWSRQQEPHASASTLKSQICEDSEIWCAPPQQHVVCLTERKWAGCMFHCPRRDAAETYLPAFEACVRHGGVSSIMCSYNAVRNA